MTVYFPPVDWTKKTPAGGVTQAGTLNPVATPAADRQLTVAAENALIRTVYGEDRIGAQIANVAVSGGSWIIQAVWCAGEIDSINSVQFGDVDLPAGVTATHYTGTTGQGVDPTLAAAITGYADTLPGIAYSVFVVPPDAVDGFPQIAAVVKGQKLYDHRTGLTVWSDNPALALADFLVRAMGKTMDYATVDALADICDELVGSDKRRTLGLTLDKSQECGQWVEVLRTYASCWLDTDGANTLLIPDRPRATDATITHAAGQIKSIRLKKRGIRNVPTVVRVRYTDTSAVPWRDAWVEADSGETPRRESEVALPGIHSYAQANREAIERLNKLRLCDLSADVEVFDEGLQFQMGDVVEVTHPYGLDAKKMRVMNVAGDYGRFRLGLSEYDPAVYSDALATGPTYTDTNLPNPASPPALAGLALEEEVYQLENGQWASRIKATWTAATWPYLLTYRFEVLVGDESIYTTVTRDAVARSPAIQEGTVYTVRVASVSSIGAIGEWINDTITPAGKYLEPGNIPSLVAYEIGGEIRVTIGAATDLDLRFYELRYDNGSKTAGVGGETWATIWAAATFIDATPAASGVGGFIASKMVPQGTWRLLACALDSVGQYSPTPATASVTVTSDINSFLVGSHDYTNPTLTGMAEYSLPADTTRYFVTEDGVPWNTKFSSAMNTYTDPLLTYHASQTSEYVTEAYDFGQSLSGSWNAELSVTDLSGSHGDAIMVSADGSTYTDQPGLAVKATGRFAKLKATATGTATLLVALPTASLRVDAIPRTESAAADVTSNASGATPVVVSGAYAAIKSAPAITPIATAARQWAVDNVTVCPYTPYAGRGSFRGDGTSAYIAVTSYTGISILAGTIEAMVLARSIPVTPGRALVQKLTSEAGTLDGYGLRVTPTGVLRGRIDSNGTITNIDSTASVCDGRWHRATLRFSASELTLFIDGGQVAQSSVSLTFRTAGPTSILGIGAVPPSNGGATWSAWITDAMQVADVRVWNTQRTDQEIFDNAFTALVGNETGLVGYWPLSETSGTAAANLVSGGNAGTRTNGLLAGMNGFDAYLFNSSGLQVADKFRWNWEGV